MDKDCIRVLKWFEDALENKNSLVVVNRWYEGNNLALQCLIKDGFIRKTNAKVEGTVVGDTYYIYKNNIFQFDYKGHGAFSGGDYLKWIKEAK